MNQEQIEAMKAQYEAQRAALIDDANRQIAMLDGAIAAMDAQLAQLAQLAAAVNPLAPALDAPQEPPQE